LNKIAGIGEYIISNNKNDVLKTFALSSCVAVVVHSPRKGAAGMVHIALPDSKSSTGGNINSGYYANTAVPLLINRICSEYGCTKDELVIKLYGGARSVRNDDVFNIGEKNIRAVKKELDSLNLRYNKIETGGVYSRTLEMEVDTGLTKVTTQPIKI
jgi:chemotaxis protein CheD